jgi:acetyl esterase/lipase
VQLFLRGNGIKQLQVRFRPQKYHTWKKTDRFQSETEVRIHKPKVLPEDGCPIFVVYHGGGFVLGGLDDEAILCRNFTQLGGIAVNVDYRLAPEHPFPVPIEDAFDALKWVCNRRFPPELG